MSAGDEPQLGSLLREYRHRSGLTLEELAERSRVSLRTISDIERGVRPRPHRHTLSVLVQALALKPHEAEMLHSLPRQVRTARLIKKVEPLRLPRMIPDFVGRDLELQRIIGLFNSAQPPAVTITGPSGYGTTTFAIAAAHAVVGQFERTLFLPMVGPDGVPITPEDAARKLMRAIVPAVTAGPDSDVIEQFQATLIGRKILIVCDDADGEAQLRPLLPAQGGSTMIITSRLPLAGLDYVARFPLTVFEFADSIRLLESIIPEQQRTAEDLRDLAQFSKNVPLSLRIAANQVAASSERSTRTVLNRLASYSDKGLGAFSAGDRSLLATFEASYARLNAAQQTMFRRLCLADGKSASVELAAALAGVPVARAQILLQELADLAIVDIDHEDRYSLSGFVEVFAKMQMGRDPDAQAARVRTDEYLLSGVAAAGWWFRTSVARALSEAGVTVAPMESAEVAAEWLLAEREDWIAAIHRAPAAGKHQLVVSLISQLHWFAQLWPHAIEWLELWRLAARSAEAIRDDAQVALNYDEIVWFLLALRRDVAGAATALEMAERFASQLSDPKYEAWSLFLRARLELERGMYKRGLRRCDDVLRLLGSSVTPEALLYALSLKAELLGRLGREEQAMQVLNDAKKRVAEYTTLDPRIRGLLWANVTKVAASVLRARGELEECIELCTDALERAPYLKGHPSMLEIASVRAAAYRDRGDAEAAERGFSDKEAVS